MKISIFILILYLTNCQLFPSEFKKTVKENMYNIFLSNEKQAQLSKQSLDSLTEDLNLDNYGYNPNYKMNEIVEVTVKKGEKLLNNVEKKLFNNDVYVDYIEDFLNEVENNIGETTSKINTKNSIGINNEIFLSLDYFVGFGNIDKSGNGEKNYIIFFGQAIQNQSVKNKSGSKIDLNNKILLHFQQLMKSDISRRFYYKFIYSDDEDDDYYG